MRELTRQLPIVSVTVYLDNPSIRLTQRATTDANGQVRFSAVSLNGTYRVFTRDDANYLESSADKHRSPGQRPAKRRPVFTH